MKIVAVVVTYNRLELLKKNIQCLYNQSRQLDEIIVVDNCSTDGTFEYCRELATKDDKFIFVHLNENTGGAGGFSVAVKKAIEENADYIWGMDDDAMPRDTALEKLINKIDYYKNDKYCFASNTYFYDKEHTLRQIQFENDCEIKHLTFVGFFISKDLVKQIGFPREDLFIYYDDLDYSMRILENRYRIIGIADSVIEHPYIMPQNDKKILFFTVNVPQMPKWKMYYWMRNNLLIRKGQKRKYVKTLVIEIYVWLKLLIFNPSNCKVAMKGIMHGICGKTGHMTNMP